MFQQVDERSFQQSSQIPINLDFSTGASEKVANDVDSSDLPSEVASDDSTVLLLGVPFQ